jgi:hypothetical protein
VSDITATTTLGDFFSAIAGRIASQLSLAGNRVFVVDKLRLQDSAVPNIQIEPVSLTALGDMSGLNGSAIEYRVHAVVKVEYDFAKRMTESLVDNKSAFLTANAAAAALKGYVPNSGSSEQVWMKLDAGTHDDLTGLVSASATMRSFVRIMADG